MPPPPRPMIDGKLRCSKCDSWKLPEGFYRNASAVTGRSPYCRQCHNAYQSAYHAANPERWRARAAAYRAANVERSKAVDAAWRAANRDKVLAGQAAWRAANPEKVREGKLRRSGWTAEAYDAALLAQGGTCANPGCDAMHSDAKKLNADHCHTTGLARVLLCQGCNQALGLLGEDSRRILGLAELNDSFNLNLPYASPEQPQP